LKEAGPRRKSESALPKCDGAMDGRRGNENDDCLIVGLNEKRVRRDEREYLIYVRGEGRP